MADLSNVRRASRHHSFKRAADIVADKVGSVSVLSLCIRNQLDDLTPMALFLYRLESGNDDAELPFIIVVLQQFAAFHVEVPAV